MDAKLMNHGGMGTDCGTCHILTMVLKLGILLLFLHANQTCHHLALPLALYTPLTFQG
jgi:hypothetical protein